MEIDRFQHVSNPMRPNKSTQCAFTNEVNKIPHEKEIGE